MPPSNWVDWERRSFMLYNKKLPWPKASAFCRSKGFRLAIIEGLDLAKKITTAMLVSRPSKFEEIINTYYL